MSQSLSSAYRREHLKKLFRLTEPGEERVSAPLLPLQTASSPTAKSGPSTGAGAAGEQLLAWQRTRASGTTEAQRQTHDGRPRQVNISDSRSDIVETSSPSSPPPPMVPIKNNTHRPRRRATPLLFVAAALLASLSLGAGLAAAAHQSPRLVDRLRPVIGKSAAVGGQINDWLLHQVAPVMATKIINNVLQVPKSSATKESSTKTISDAIDTQALADKIVDKVADQIKKNKKSRAKLSEAAPLSEAEPPTDAKRSKGSSRKGKSLVGDTLQTLFAANKDNRKLFARAMEKRLPGRGGGQANSWLMVKEPQYDQQLFASTDSSQLDENPVVLRAEHGHNLTTVATPSQQQQQDAQQSSSQMAHKLLQKHRLQQKYVHTNRHQQQHLAPKPWLGANTNQRRPQHQHQSPYSYQTPQVTSDINIVQPAPSSPAPPAYHLATSSSTPTTTTTTSTSTTTPQPPAPFSFLPHQVLQATSASIQQQPPVTSPATVTHIGANKFKVNNRHQHPLHTVSMAPNSWASSNRGPHNQYTRLQQQQQVPTTTSTTSTTTTTTTTTTTPEPPPPEPEMTEPMMADMLEPQTSSPGSSLLPMLGAAVIDTIGDQIGSSSSNSDYINYPTNSSYGSSTSSSSSGGTKSSSSGSSSASTTARHSVLTSEAIPTALGAPLYHLNRPNFTATSILGPSVSPASLPKRSSSSPAAKAAVQYFQKGLNSISSTIFGRQSKSWARRLGLSSVLLSGLLYGAAILSNPGAPLPTTGLEVLQMLTKNKRRGSRETILPPIASAEVASHKLGANINFDPSLMDTTVLTNLLYQQPQLIPIFEQLIKQEQLQQQQQHPTGMLITQSRSSSPIEIESLDTGATTESRSISSSPSHQFYTIQAMPQQPQARIHHQQAPPSLPSSFINYGANSRNGLQPIRRRR